MAGKLRRITLQVPERFLNEFDSFTEGLYASRNEAIRAGMIMVIESLSHSRRERTEK